MAAVEELLHTTFAAMAEGAVVQGTAGHIVDCNVAAERILGLTSAQRERRGLQLNPRLCQERHERPQQSQVLRVPDYENTVAEMKFHAISGSNW